MRILIEMLSHDKQRYETVGDWQWLKLDYQDYLVIKVSELNDDKMNCLVAVHELIEALLCRFHEPEITTKDVDAFDMNHQAWEEPGESPESPYHDQHVIATDFEMLLCARLGVNWKEYEKKIQSL